MDLQRIKEEAASRVEIAAKGKKKVAVTGAGSARYDSRRDMLVIERPTEFEIDVTKALPESILEGLDKEAVRDIASVLPLSVVWLTALSKSPNAKYFKEVAEPYHFSEYRKVPASAISKLGDRLTALIVSANAFKSQMKRHKADPFAVGTVYDAKGNPESFSYDGAHSSEVSAKELKLLDIDLSSLAAKGAPTKANILNFILFYAQEEDKLPKGKAALQNLLDLISDKSLAKKGISPEWKYVHKSVATLKDVIEKKLNK